MKKFENQNKEIVFFFCINEWKFTKGKNNRLLAAVFDIGSQNLTLWAPFNCRKRLEMILGEKVINHENRVEHRFSVFHVIDKVGNIF